MLNIVITDVLMQEIIRGKRLFYLDAHSYQGQMILKHYQETFESLYDKVGIKKNLTINLRAISRNANYEDLEITYDLSIQCRFDWASMPIGELICVNINSARI